MMNISNSQPRTKLFLLLATLLLAALACSLPFTFNNDSDTGSASSTAADTGSSDDLTLDCEREGYACSPAEMSQENFDRIRQVGDDVAARLNEEQTLFEIEAWLQDQEGVTFTVTDGRVLVFRVDGSVPIIIEHPAVVAAQNQEGSNQPHSPHLTRNQFNSPDLSGIDMDWGPDEVQAAQVVSQETEVVGSQRDNREEKFAHVLEPYAFDFLSPSSADLVNGRDVSQILEAARWYADRVQYKENTSVDIDRLTKEGFSNPTVSLSDFEDWQKYDVVHLHTHGKAACEDPENIAPGNCTTYFSTGIFYTVSSVLENRSKFRERRGIGLEIIHSSIPEHNVETDVAEVAILPDFFRNTYSSGELENMILSFSSCEILFEADMHQALKQVSKDTDLFAFTRSVYTKDSTKAFTNLYRDMVEKGLSAEDAYDRMPQNMKEFQASSSIGYENQVYNIPEDRRDIDDDGVIELEKDYIQEFEDTSKKTTLKHHKLGRKTNHIREVITLQDPHTNEILQPGNLYELNGVPNDGEPEQIDVQFLVEGYTKEEIENEGITITFKVEGETVLFNQVIFPDNPDDDVEVAQQEEYAWRVRVAGVEIPDLQPDQTLTFRAELDLPAGSGISVHEVEPLSIPRDVQAVVTSPDTDWNQEIAEYVTTHDADNGITRTRIVTPDGAKMTFYYHAPTSTSYLPDGEGGYFEATSKVDPGSGLNTLQEFSLPSTNFSFSNLSNFPDMAAIFARITIFAQVNEEMLLEGGYQKQSETQFVYSESGVTNTFLFDDHGRVSEVRFESVQGNGVINYHYQDFELTLPENTQPLPEMFDTDNGE